MSLFSVLCSLPDSPARYNEKDQRSMLVWCPNSQLSDAMCTQHTLPLHAFIEIFFSLCLINCLFLVVPVDEYILMAKEKHGYNMEQVRKAAKIKGQIFS